MLKRICVLALFLFPVLAHAQAITKFTYQSQASLSSGFSATYAAASGSGTTANVDLVCGGAGSGCVDTGVYPSNFTVQLLITGSPSACTVAMNGSLVQNSGTIPGSAFKSVTGNVDCTTTTLFSVANTPLKTINFTLTFSGGTAPTVQVIVVGKH